MNANIDFIGERKELDGHELPKNGEFKSENNTHKTDLGANNRFNPRSGCMNITTVTNRTLRAGNRVSAIVYKETADADWNAYMIHPIQVGVPEMGALGELDEKEIGECEGSPETVIRMDATLTPATDDLKDMDSGLAFSEIDILSGQTSIQFPDN